MCRPVPGRTQKGPGKQPGMRSGSAWKPSDQFRISGMEAPIGWPTVAKASFLPGTACHDQGGRAVPGEGTEGGTMQQQVQSIEKERKCEREIGQLEDRYYARQLKRRVTSWIEQGRPHKR